MGNENERKYRLIVNDRCDRMPFQSFETFNVIHRFKEFRGQFARGEMYKGETRGERIAEGGGRVEGRTERRQFV